MALVQVRECDRCHQRLGDKGGRYVIEATVRREIGSVQTERDVEGEYCGAGCALAALKDLVDEVQAGGRLNVVA